MIKRVRAEWRDVILVCRKCSKRVGGGFGKKKDQRLAKALRKALAAPGAKTKGRKADIGVIEAGCFDICPKKAITTVRAGSPGTWHIVPKGMPIDEVIAGLGLEAVPTSDDD